jgi:hemolysin activation/secretion protein
MTKRGASPPARPRLHRAFVLLAATCVSVAIGVRTEAQTIERHEAPGLETPTTPQIAPAEPTADQDTRPLGANLASVALLTADAPLPANVGPGRIDSRQLAPPNRAALDRRVARFIGQPLSRALISRIEAVIVDHYRRAGRPFVAVKLPPQDITDGTLRLRVVEFRLGRKSAMGASAAVDTSIVDGVRAAPGQAIDGSKLQQDLDWLNHSPFRAVTAVFAPGADTGLTDLELQAHATRPWQVFAGYANSGTPSDGLDRWLLGGEIGDLVRPGSLVSFQLTASDDFWFGHTTPFGAAGNPQYVSYSLVASLPLAPRQDFTVVADDLQSNTPSKDFEINSRTAEISGVYRTALSNFVPAPGDGSIGIEVRNQRNSTDFGDTLVSRTNADIAQLVSGWSDSWTDPRWRQSLSLNLRYSPGGLFGGNDDINLLRASNGRVDSADYVYGDIAYTGDFHLVGAWRYVTSVNAQLADKPLFSTEQTPIGGDPGVRLYVYDDGSFDDGVVWRNEIRTPPISLANGTILSPVLLPYVFADTGYARDLGSKDHEDASSVGGGSDWRIGSGLTGGVTAGWALQNAAYTRAGAFNLLANIRFTY